MPEQTAGALQLGQGLRLQRHVEAGGRHAHPIQPQHGGDQRGFRHVVHQVGHAPPQRQQRHAQPRVGGVALEHAHKVAQLPPGHRRVKAEGQHALCRAIEQRKLRAQRPGQLEGAIQRGVNALGGHVLAQDRNVSGQQAADHLGIHAAGLHLSGYGAVGGLVQAQHIVEIQLHVVVARLRGSGNLIRSGTDAEADSFYIIG